jgi:hypothetical protein
MTNVVRHSTANNAAANTALPLVCSQTKSHSGGALQTLLTAGVRF